MTLAARAIMDRRAAIAAMGQRLGPDVLQSVQALFTSEQQPFVEAQPPTAVDQAYGDHPRQKLDLYAPERTSRLPVLLWVYGGGFVQGEKASLDHPFNAHIGRWAAREGLIGAVMDYRLAPDHRWPAGGEDVGGAVDWLRTHAKDFGGDPDAIFLAGTSAGSMHISTFLKLRHEREQVRGVVLLSGLYGFTPFTDRDAFYFGDEALFSDKTPRHALIDTTVPLFVAFAELDPPRFQAEALGLLTARLKKHGKIPRAYFANDHNHYSMATHIGGADNRLAAEILSFVSDCLNGCSGAGPMDRD